MSIFNRPLSTSTRDNYNPISFENLLRNYKPQKSLPKQSSQFRYNENQDLEPRGEKALVDLNKKIKMVREKSQQCSSENDKENVQNFSNFPPCNQVQKSSNQTIKMYESMDGFPLPK